MTDEVKTTDDQAVTITDAELRKYLSQFAGFVDDCEEAISHLDGYKFAFMLDGLQAVAEMCADSRGRYFISHLSDLTAAAKTFFERVTEIESSLEQHDKAQVSAFTCGNE